MLATHKQKVNQICLIRFSLFYNEFPKKKNINRRVVVEYVIINRS